MRPTEDIERSIRNVSINANTEKDKQVLDDILNTMDKSLKTQSPAIRPYFHKIILASKAAVATIAILLIAVSVIMVLNRSASPVWAMEQTIEALKEKNAVYMTGTSITWDRSHTRFELWARSNEGQVRSEELVMRLDNGEIVWVEKDATHIYVPDSNTVLIDRARTAGFDPWIGPELFDVLARIPDCTTVYRTDPSTGAKYAVFTCSYMHTLGYWSYMFEFDTETKLPVSVKSWRNPDKQGEPHFYAQTITYPKTLPDNAFVVDIPKNVRIIEMDIFIPEENLALLRNPKYGMVVQDLSKEQACHKILEKFWDAIITDDLQEVRKLLPLYTTWSDEMIKAMISHKDRPDQILEVLEIEAIIKEDSSRLGPVVVVPSLVRCQDGKTRRMSMIIQLRNLNGTLSCVIHGPYGRSVQIE